MQARKRVQNFSDKRLETSLKRLIHLQRLKSNKSKRAKSKEPVHDLLTILCHYEIPQQVASRLLIRQKPEAIQDLGETNQWIEIKQRADIPAPHDYKSQKGRLP